MRCSDDPDRVDVQVADSLAAAARMLHGVTPDHVQIVTGLSLPDGSDAESR